ncbi:hypothetical protein ACFL35_06975 [Candidatus Riflebacteria bacterium]
MNQLIEKIKEKPEEGGQYLVVLLGLMFLIQFKFHKPFIIEKDMKVLKKVDQKEKEIKKIKGGIKNIDAIQAEIESLQKNTPDISKFCFHVDQKRDAVEEVLGIFARYKIKPKKYDQDKLEARVVDGLQYFTQQIRINVVADYWRLTSLLFDLENFEKILNVELFNLSPIGGKQFFSIRPMVITIYYHEEKS